MLVAWLAAGVLAATGAAATSPDNPDLQGQKAHEAVTAARSAVEQAARSQALWTTARDALRDAESALAREDYVAAERSARFAAEQAKLGIEQLGYPEMQ
jgi:hypothetical protein